eukprot:CAMPEP_0117550514 /NCGR_PEP_ID=MMETSP0784-20121206/48721_1 /TAXON_ID=39447 /ORGANISM="" /LENGTH=431 /DNA_ID=CAMNT_0005347537 /DNA_START=56 /DNA_END=1351 /DNA_ORIENTATION=-
MTCRICHIGPHQELGELLAPCHCKGEARLVHRGCLDSWRAVGFSLSNLTECNVCHYDYQFGSISAAYLIQAYLLGRVAVEVGFFFFVACVAGYVMKTSQFLDDVDFGNLRAMKPDSNKGWLFLGCAFNFFILGILAICIVISRWCCRTSSQDVADDKIARACRNRGGGDASWVSVASSNQNCCDSCCLACELGLCCNEWCGSCCSPSLGAPSCDRGCCKGGDKCSCGDDNPLGAVLAVIALVFVIVIIAIGLLFFFWILSVNAVYVLRAHYSDIRKSAAKLYLVHSSGGDVAADDEEKQHNNGDDVEKPHKNGEAGKESNRKKAFEVIAGPETSPTQEDDDVLVEAEMTWNERKSAVEFARRRAGPASVVKKRIDRLDAEIDEQMETLRQRGQPMPEWFAEWMALKTSTLPPEQHVMEAEEAVLTPGQVAD